MRWNGTLDHINVIFPGKTIRVFSVDAPHDRVSDKDLSRIYVLLRLTHAEELPMALSCKDYRMAAETSYCVAKSCERCQYLYGENRITLRGEK